MTIKMRTRPAKVLLLLALAPLATACASTQPTRPISLTSVHHYDGQRVDVPSHDLAGDGSGLLRSGLMPEPLEGG